MGQRKDRLQAVREEQFGPRGKSRMARELGVPQATYSGYESGRMAVPDDLGAKLFERFRVNPQWFYHGQGERYVQRPPGTAFESAVDLLCWYIERAERAEGELAEERSRAGEAEEDVVRVPIYGGQAGAGAGGYVQEEAEDYAWCYAPDTPHPDATTAVRVAGESMEPLVGDGGLVGIDHSVRDLDAVLAGRLPLCAVRDPGSDGVLIRWAERVGGVAIFRPRAEGDYTTVVWRIGEEESPILGRVVWIYRRV